MLDYLKIEDDGKLTLPHEVRGALRVWGRYSDSPLLRLKAACSSCRSPMLQ